MFGESLEKEPGELSFLVGKVQAGKLAAKKVDVQSDGDTRYWEVDASQIATLRRLKDFAEAHFVEVVGRPPARSFIMVNRIDAGKSPAGSGAGWHRDSFRTQYKAIVYITDVERESQGAFCFVPSSNAPLFRLASALYRVLTGGNRYSDRLMSVLLRAGVSRRVVLSKAGIPFFVNTSMIHRGLPISEGQRIAATVYMFGEDDAAEVYG